MFGKRLLWSIAKMSVSRDSISIDWVKGTHYAWHVNTVNGYVRNMEMGTTTRSFLIRIQSRMMILNREHNSIYACFYVTLSRNLRGARTSVPKLAKKKNSFVKKRSSTHNVYYHFEEMSKKVFGLYNWLCIRLHIRIHSIHHLLSSILYVTTLIPLINVLGVFECTWCMFYLNFMFYECL